MTRLALVLALLGGCHALGLSCTEMGCMGILEITFDGELAEGAEVTVLLDGEPFACGIDGALCQLAEDGSGVTLQMSGTDEPEVVVRVTVDDTSDNYTLAPTWDEPYFPNGEACDGKDGGCLDGEATLAL